MSKKIDLLERFNLFQQIKGRHHALAAELALRSGFGRLPQRERTRQ
jgi:hypothetical protein